MKLDPATLDADYPITRSRPTKIPTGERLPVTCWCETEILLVPRAVVLDGRTGSCGRPTCKAKAA